ncbi:MAG: hypothetical protein QG632_294 [Candidatus Dependentiae bacterium]|nr:hypothetical protein [Candidatus Dependentiae bacterium]
MKKRYLLFFCATTLAAQHDPFSADTFNIAGTLEFLQMQSYTIRDTILANERTANLFGAEIDILINKLTTTKVDPAHISVIQQAVHRYHVIANACLKVQQDPDNLERLITLFEQRKTIVQEIEIASRPCMYANLILYNLAQHLGHQPTPTEVQSFTKQRDDLVSARGPLLTTLNEKLFSIEQEIFRDHRSWLEKYGTTVKNSLIILGVLVIIGRAIDMTHAQLTKK